MGRFRRQELAAIAVESSQAERRADDAERELMEWKKMQVHGRTAWARTSRGSCCADEVWIFCGAG